MDSGLAATRRPGMTKAVLPGPTSMQPLRFLFSPSGRLSPQAFVLAAVAVYLAGAASHLLTLPEVIARTGLWPFVAAQALLIWIWFTLHAKRLRDAGRAVGLAAGVSLLYSLSVMLLIIVAASFYNALAGEVPDANTASALGLILLVSIVAILLGSPHYDLAWLMVAILLLIAFVPVIVAVVVSLWAAIRPSGGSVSPGAIML
jgi:uncharacterized membrane protein YhaH (DUF805 family)